MLASSMGTLVSQPFYVLTTRQQAGVKVTGKCVPLCYNTHLIWKLTGDAVLANKLISGVLHGLKSSIRKLGARGLFRKLHPNIMVCV